MRLVGGAAWRMRGVNRGERRASVGGGGQVSSGSGRSGSAPNTVDGSDQRKTGLRSQASDFVDPAAG